MQRVNKRLGYQLLKGVYIFLENPVLILTDKYVINKNNDDYIKIKKTKHAAKIVNFLQLRLKARTGSTFQVVNTYHSN